MSVLVTGGAGYIGSVTVELLRQSGQDVVVLDNLFRGHREAIDTDVPFYQGQIGDRPLLDRIADSTRSTHAFTSPLCLCRRIGY